MRQTTQPPRIRKKQTVKIPCSIVVVGPMLSFRPAGLMAFSHGKWEYYRRWRCCLRPSAE
jgi:hypothetical protein